MKENTTPTGSDASLPMRALRFEDVPDALRLVRRAIEHGCRGHYDPAQRAAVYACYANGLFIEAAQGPFETIVAERHGRIVAIGQVDPADDRLRALFVDADCQGHGIGHTLLAAVEARALARGGKRLHGAMAVNAVGFYLRAGFRPEGGGPARLGSAAIAIPILRMAKALGGGGDDGRRAAHASS